MIEPKLKCDRPRTSTLRIPQEANNNENNKVISPTYHYKHIISPTYYKQNMFSLIRESLTKTLTRKF